jgi:hypothetical protein
MLFLPWRAFDRQRAAPMLACVLGLWALPMPVTAALQVNVCYNYECSASATVPISAEDMAWLLLPFATVQTPAEERAAINVAMGRFRVLGARHSPIGNDKGFNGPDEEVDGRMDCIDHSTNNERYLRLLAQQGALHHHDVVGRLRRNPWLLDVHWGALIRERASRQEFVVDSWFFDHGLPAVTYPRRDWLAGASPKTDKQGKSIP